MNNDFSNKNQNIKKNRLKEIEELKNFIANAEESLEKARKALAELIGKDWNQPESARPQKVITRRDGITAEKIIEGVFNGENMVDAEGRVYPVPANYASKSKLVEGDRLKLTIAADGSFIFKQIGPVARKNIIGQLIFENNMYQVLAEGKRYNILFASITYFKAKPGDRVTVIVPKDGNSQWAALENIIYEEANSEHRQVSELGIDISSDNFIDNDNLPVSNIQNSASDQTIKSDANLIETYVPETAVDNVSDSYRIGLKKITDNKATSNESLGSGYLNDDKTIEQNKIKNLGNSLDIKQNTTNTNSDNFTESATELEI